MIRGAWSTSSKVAEKEIQIRLEVPNWHLKLVIVVISTFREFSKREGFPSSYCCLVPNARCLKISLSDPGHTDKLLSGLILYPLSLCLYPLYRGGSCLSGLTLSTITCHEHGSSPVHDHGGFPNPRPGHGSLPVSAFVPSLTAVQSSKVRRSMTRPRFRLSASRRAAKRALDGCFLLH